ncbi:MAG: hypothetical protein Q8L98_06935 [Chlamydiales bacterium]|nr:hypothetical protein [Chlamydiales bacterium]
MHSVNNNLKELLDYSQRLPNEYKRIQTLEEMQKNLAADHRKETARAWIRTAFVIIPLAAALIALTFGSNIGFFAWGLAYMVVSINVGFIYDSKFKEETGRSLIDGRALRVALSVAGLAMIMPIIFVTTRKERIEESLKTAIFTMNGSAVCWQVRADETDLFKEELRTADQLASFLAGSRAEKDVTTSELWLEQLQTKANKIKQATQ